MAERPSVSAVTVGCGPPGGLPLPTRRLWYNIGMDKLYRSSDEKVVAGVCAGLAHKLDLNANGLRCVVVLVTIFMTGIPLFVYAALWMILKERPTGGGVIDV